MNVLSDEELEAVIETAKHKYHQEYVEPLEKENKKLLKKIEKLKNENSHIRGHNTKLKNQLQCKKTTVLDEGDAERYRKMCSSLKKEKERLERMLEIERGRRR